MASLCPITPAPQTQFLMGFEAQWRLHVLWHAHLRGEETSLNPLGMVEALIGAMDHAASLASVKGDSSE